MASFWWKNILDLSEVEFCRVPRICRISKPIVVVLVSQGPSSVPHPLSSRHQFHTKVPLLFSPQNPSVPHQKTLSCTPPVQHTPLNSLIKSLYRAFLVLNWGGVLNWGVLVWNWGILGAEKEWPFCVELMCWTEGDPTHWLVPFWNSRTFLKEKLQMVKIYRLNFWFLRILVKMFWHTKIPIISYFYIKMNI